ncbi:MAG TPA: hypothetical protein VMH49_03435 [Thermoplasmata archaeon]|nr:hypothetical protein [Thermoplasmata archaeon]
MVADSPLVRRAVRTGGLLLAVAAAQLVAVLLWVQERSSGFSPWSTTVTSLARGRSLDAVALAGSLLVLGVVAGVALLLAWSAFDPRPSRSLGLLVLVVAAGASAAAGGLLLLPGSLAGSLVAPMIAAAVVAAGIGLLVVSRAMHQHGRWRVSAAYTLATGLVLLGAGALDYAHLRFGLGSGGLERIVLGAALLWALVEGTHLALLHRFAPGLLVKVAAA